MTSHVAIFHLDSRKVPSVWEDIEKLYVDDGTKIEAVDGQTRWKVKEDGRVKLGRA